MKGDTFRAGAGPVRLALADDSALLREALAAALVQHGFDIVGQAADAEGLLRIVEDEEPDAVIVDIRMPPTYSDEGIRAAREIRTRAPGTAVLVLSQHLEAAYAATVLDTPGARIGYLLKDRVANIGELTDALQRIVAGETVLDPAIVRRLLARPRVPGPLKVLTERELEVLALMAEGRTNTRIADDLVISVRTVETHISSILLKLGISPANGHPRVLAVLHFLRT